MSKSTPIARRYQWVMNDRICSQTLIAVATIFFLVGAAFAWRHTLAFPPCCDVEGYWKIADHYGQYGIFSKHHWGALRTYAYPTFLLVWLDVSDWMGWEPRAVVTVVQTLLYLASAHFLVDSIPGGRRLRAIRFALLACNVFVMPYLAIALADVLALTLFQVWLGAVLRHRCSLRSGGSDTTASQGWLALAAVSAGTALAVRPAYVWLPFVTVLVALNAGREHRLVRAGFRLCLLCALTILPLLPQILINRLHFDSLSPLPATDLGNMHLNWGQSNFKYATLLYPEATRPQLFYPSPFHTAADDAPDAEPLDWYLEHPGAALATMVAKFVGVFDFDFIEPYVYHPHPPGQTLLRLLSLGLLVVGVTALAAQALALLQPAHWIGPRLLPVMLLAGWSSINLLSVPELRFGLPMLSLFLVLTPGLFLAVRELGRSKTLIAMASITAATAAFFAIGELVRARIAL